MGQEVVYVCTFVCLLKAGFVTAPDLSEIESLNSPQRLELVKLNKDVILASLAAIFQRSQQLLLFTVIDLL